MRVAALIAAGVLALVFPAREARAAASLAQTCRLTEALSAGGDDAGT